MDLQQIQHYAALVGGGLIVARTILGHTASFLEYLSRQLTAMDLEDGQRDWPWTRRLSRSADILGMFLRKADSVAAMFPFRGVGTGVK